MKKTIGLLAGILLAVAAPLAADLVNDAEMDAVSQARDSLTAAREARPAVGAVRRIGVVDLEGDDGRVTRLLRSMLANTAFEVVLVSDEDLEPLLQEYLRQVRRSDLINPETAHELRQQGVDAILFGRVEPAVVEPFREGNLRGERAEVRILLDLASLAEENPGSLVWSEQVLGTAQLAQAVTLDERAGEFYTDNRLVIHVVGGAVVVLLGLLLLRSVYRNAIRPR